ncbi:MAG TPA: phosphoribosylanthranilate isomerase [Bacteroidota bacterium]|nr:phosphoribosylanthranilate isomerase [Bacteroidota bacterium]
MQDLFVKFCGITNLEDARFAASLGADAVGFIFYPQSERYVDPQKAAEIVARLPEHVSKIGVFVNASKSEILDVVGSVKLSAVQLYGKEGPDDLVNFETSVIKVFRVDPTFDVERMKNYIVDAFLLDTYHAGLYGGSGKTFDWNIAVKAKEYGKIILSGGLNPDNIEAAIRLVQPYGVDVSSGVERAPGKKDREKMRDFISRARNANLIYNVDTE